MERDRDWVRLGRAFAEARKKIPLTQEEAAGQLHVSRTPIQAIERGQQSNGKPFTKITATMRGYARLVGWADGSIDRVLDGYEPETAEPPQPERAGPQLSFSDLSPDVQMELHSGRTLGSQVLHLGPSESDARVIVVLKAGEDMTEEQMDEVMRDWRKRRRHLQGIATDPEASSDD